MPRLLAVLLVALVTACGEPAGEGIVEVDVGALRSAARSEAMARYAAGDYAAFVRLMEPVVEQGNVDVDWYNLACGYALVGDRDKALDTLEVVAARGRSYGMADDPDLASLHGDPRFREILATVTVHERADDFLDPYRADAMDAYHDGRYAEFTLMMEQIAKYSAAEVDVYNLACGYALTGQRDAAIATLRSLFARSADFGAATDDDFASLRDDPEFIALIATAP